MKRGQGLRKKQLSVGRELQGDQYYEESSTELEFGKIWGWSSDNEVSTFLHLKFSHLQNEYTYCTLYLIVCFGVLSIEEQLNL